VFHLMTHAFFKALLFLGAGSVIMGMHHNQDIRWMGGLRKYMPITWITFLLGSLALIGTPFFSGFYSKDSIIEAVHASTLPAAGFAYFAVLAGVFVTALYSFRLYFLVFHGKERYDQNPDAHHDAHHGEPRPRSRRQAHEQPAVVWVPLVLLAIPSVVIGAMTLMPMLFGDFFKAITSMARATRRWPRWPRKSTAGGHGPARPDGAAHLAGAGRCGAATTCTWSTRRCRRASRRCSGPSTRCWTTSTTWTGSGSRSSRAACASWVSACGRAWTPA
jgi:NADH:ubiquinone oxidoreductase subunit 5 (subunit L)/multisubunit Na+/H+ antiporter MnhA subunit